MLFNEQLVACMFGGQFQMNMVIMKMNNQMSIQELKRLQGPHGKGNLDWKSRLVRLPERALASHGASRTHG